VAGAAVRAIVPVGDGPNAVAVTPDGRTAYVTNSFTRFPGMVSVLDLASATVRGSVVVHRVPNRVAVSPDGTRVYVTNFRSWNLSIIDAATDAVVETLRVDSKPTSVAVNPNGAYAYVTTNSYGGNVFIVETATNQVTGVLPVGLDPRAIATERRGGLGYVANFGADTVSVLDLADEIDVGEIAVGSRPFALAVNCVGSACSAPPYTPKPTKTPTYTPTVPTPTATSTVTLTPTSSKTPTRTPTLRPGLEHVVIEIGGARAMPGERVPVEVTLRTGGQTVYGVAHAIEFTSTLRIATRAAGVPACALDAGSDATARFEFEPSGCDVDCARMRVSIAARAPVADGALLYRCAVDVAPFTPVGTLRLVNADVGASGPRGEVLATRGLDGLISVVPRPTPTSGPTPPPEVFLRLGSVSGQPGERVGLTVHLDASGHDIAGVQNDIEFDSDVAIPALDNGRPDCSVNPGIDKHGTAFAFQPPGCAGTQCTQVRAVVLALDNTDPIPDGALLYTCQVDIAPTAAAGAHPLRSSNVGASTPDGDAIPAEAVGGSITVLGTGSVRQAAVGTAARLCSGGDRQGLTCDADVDCPFGACAGVQGVCDGGEDDGLLCDCPGGTCGGRPACGSDPQRGTCRGGDLDGQCCDRAFNCSDGAACIRTFKLCASGPSKGIPCLDDRHCVGAACVIAGRSCKGGAFHGSSCIDDADCPLGACVSPPGSGPTGGTQATPTFTPASRVPVGSSHDGGGCTIGGSRTQGGAWLSLCTLLLFVARRRARR